MNGTSKRLALVTGATRGIGRAIALALGASGNVVVGTATTGAGAATITQTLSDAGVAGEGVALNVTDAAAVDAMLDAIQKKHGDIAILVNNAGITRDKTFLKMTRTLWDEVLGVNLTGTFNVTRAVLPAMVEQGWGRVINLTSIVGQTGNFGQTNYAVAKGGIIAFTMTLAREVARKGVTVNAVAPGFIETDMTKDLPEAGLATVKALTPLGRLGRPEEVAAAIVFLASPLASYITGQVIPVNGGMYM